MMITRKEHTESPNWEWDEDNAQEEGEEPPGTVKESISLVIDVTCLCGIFTTP